MTAICGGGTSSPRAGVGGVLTIGAAAIEVFISSVLALPEMAPILAPVIAGLVDIEIAAYCGTDPPADPGLTADIVADAIAIPPSFTTFESQQKILQWFESRYWYQICQCNSVTTPTPPTPSNPGPASTDAGLPIQPTPCWSVVIPYSVPAASGITNAQFVDMTPYALPAGQTVTTAWAPGLVPAVTVQAVKLPAGVTNVQLSATINEAFTPGVGGEVQISYQGFQSSGTTSPGDSMSIAWNATGVFGRTSYVIAAVPSTTSRTGVVVQNSDIVVHSGTISLSFFCAPGVNVGPACCPPDPILEGELQQILQYVQAIYAALGQINSFAEGTVHASLSGNGSITFSGVPIALKVQLTIPPNVGFEVGSPYFYFDVGYLSFSTSEGNYAQERLSLVDQVVQVPLLAGSVGYTLLNGVTATITELVPGP